MWGAVFAGVAQSVERTTFNRVVAGSNPAVSTWSERVVMYYKIKGEVVW